MTMAYRGFPAAALRRVLCVQPGCEGALRIDAPDACVMQAAVRCERCGHGYRIEAGILRLLDPQGLHAESDHERHRRDEQAQGIDHAWEATDWGLMEIHPTLNASEPLRQAQVLELGAGTGRYSVRMAERGATLTAVDFSFHALRALAERVQAGWDIALIEGDCTTLRVPRGAFDLVASTLVSNLPTPAHREALYRLAAQALREGGKFVFSTHHFSWRKRWRGEPQSGHYRAGGIYRYLFTQHEIRREVARHFRDVACRPMQIHVPGSGKLKVRVPASRAAEWIWPLNCLGELLLVAARKPLRALSAFLITHATLVDDLSMLLDAAEMC